MRSRLRPSPAMVVALIALFVSIGGVGYAASKIGTNDIKNGAVTNKKLHKNAVKTKKINKQAVKAGKIGPLAVQTGKIGDLAVTTDKIADQTVTTDKIADQAVTTDKITDQAVTTGKIADGAVTSSKVDGSIVTADTVGVPIAGANIAADGTVRRFFNRVGGAPAVDHTAASGIYTLTFPGLEGQVLNSASVSLATIQSASFGDVATVSSSGGDPRIRTADGAGVAADRSFEYVIIQRSP